MSDFEKWNEMTDTQRLVSWRECRDQLFETRAWIRKYALTAWIATHDEEGNELPEPISLPLAVRHL